MVHLDLASLVWLYATFDKQIQRLLHSRLAIGVLDLGALNKLPVGPTHYFLHAIRDVRRLEFPKAANLSPSSISLFSTLNPSELVLDGPILHPSVQELIRDATDRPLDPVLAHTKTLIQSFGIPRFCLLTPNLHTLELRSQLRKIGHDGPERGLDITLPSSLTSISLPFDGLSSIKIKILPTSLTHLQLFRATTTELLDIFEHLTSLASLSLRYKPSPINDEPGATSSSRAHIRAPSSLTKLKVSTENFPTSLLAGPLLERCEHLVYFKLSCRDLQEPEQPVDVLHIAFPVSLQSLKLSPSLSYQFVEHMTLPTSTQPFVVSLPPSLTELSLKNFLNGTLLNALSAQLPTSLHRLSVIPPLRSRRSRYYYENVPRFSLSVPLRWLTEFCSHNLDLASSPQLLRKLAPQCRLRFPYPIAPFCYDRNGHFLCHKFAHLIAPVLDLVALHAAIDDYATSENMTFDLEIDTIYNKRLETTEHFVYLPDLPSLVLYGRSVNWYTFNRLVEYCVHSEPTISVEVDHLQLDEYYRHEFASSNTTLAHLNLGSCPFATRGQYPSLTHLSSLATVDATALTMIQPGTKLSVLYAPNWTFTASFLTQYALDDCEVFSCRITDMKDTEVVTFLTEKVSYKTRQNMSVSISVLPSAEMRRSEEGEAAVNYDNLARLMIDNLEVELDAPMPAEDSASTGNDESEPKDTIGSVVNAIDVVVRSK